MITRINDSKILTKHTPNVNASLTLVNVTRIKSGIMINVSVSAKIQKNITHVQDYFWNPSTCSCANFDYLGITIDV